MSLNTSYESALMTKKVLLVVKSFDTRRKKDVIGSAIICLRKLLIHNCQSTDPWPFDVDLIRSGNQSGNLTGQIAILREGNSVAARRHNVFESEPGASSSFRSSYTYSTSI